MCHKLMVWPLIQSIIVASIDFKFQHKKTYSSRFKCVYLLWTYFYLNANSYCVLFMCMFVNLIVKIKWNTKGRVNNTKYSPHFKVCSVSALLCKITKKHAKSRTSRHLPVRASTWVVMWYVNALQFSKREGHAEQEHIHPSSLKHWLLRVRQIVMFTLPLFELEGHHNLTKTKTWIKHILNISKLRNIGKWKQAHRHSVHHLRSGASPSSVACLHIHKVVVHGTWMVVLQQSHLTLWTQVFYHITGIFIKDLVYQWQWMQWNQFSIEILLCVNIFR